MSTALLGFLLLWASSLAACSGASISNALDLISNTTNFYQKHQPTKTAWMDLMRTVLELINDELDQLEAASHNPSSMANSLFTLFQRRFTMFYPKYASLTNVSLKPARGFRSVANITEVFVKPMDCVKRISKICTVDGTGHILADKEGMVLRTCRVNQRIDFSVPNSLAYIVIFGNSYPNADKATIKEWITLRKKARAATPVCKKISSQVIPHLESYHPSVLDELQRGEIYPKITRLVDEATKIHLRLQEPLGLRHSESTVALLYYRFFFPCATYLESSSRGPTRNHKVVAWLGIRIGEHVTVNQVVAKCTDGTVLLSRITGLAVKIHMKIGEGLPNHTFAVLDPCQSSKGCHANTPLLLNAFHGGELEAFVGYLIEFTDINKDDQKIAQALPTPPKSPTRLLLELYAHQMKRMNTTLDELQLEFVSRLQLIKITVPNHSFHNAGFEPYTIISEKDDGVLCKDCIVIAINSTHCYAFVLDPSVVIP